MSESGRCKLTRVVKEGVDKATVFEVGSYWGDILKIAVDERGVDESDRFEPHTDKPGKRKERRNRGGELE